MFIAFMCLSVCLSISDTPPVSPSLFKWHLIFQSLFMWFGLVSAWWSSDRRTSMVTCFQEAGSRSFQPVKGYTQPHCPSATSEVIVKVLMLILNQKVLSGAWHLIFSKLYTGDAFAYPGFEITGLGSYRRNTDCSSWFISINPLLPFLVKPPFPFKDHSPSF